MSPRSLHKIRKTIEVLKDDYEWYIRTHKVSDDSNQTGHSALHSLLLSKYREVCENYKNYDFTEMTPNEIAKKAAEETQKEFEPVGDREIREGVEEDE